MVLPEALHSRVYLLNERLGKLKRNLSRDDDDDDDYELDRRQQAGEKRLVKILRDACALVREEATYQRPYFPELIQTIQQGVDKCVEYAYGESHLFDFMPSWAHNNESGQPLVLDTTEGRLPLPVGLFGNFLRELGMEDRSRGNIPPGPWKDTPKHPKASRLSRLRPRKFDLTPTPDHRLARIIYDARCEIQSSSVSVPIDMHLSSGNGCLAVVGAGGYKLREPHLEYFVLDGNEEPSGFPAYHFVKPGLADVAVHAALDETRHLIFVADKQRVKSFAWAAANGNIHEQAHPTHTLASSQAHGPLAVLPNGTVIRAGIGEVAVWNIDQLPTHGTAGRKIIGSKDLNISRNAWRDDLEDIELSAGSPATSSIQLAGSPSLSIGRWRSLVQTPSTMICQANQYGCAAIDLEHGGSIATRYLGHGGHLTDLAVSDGDAQVFLTACSDGFARLFDRRMVLPVLTFDACQNTESCDAAVLAHPDGIPTVFTGTTKGEQIKLWDVRARSPVYELATGNNSVQALAWDVKHNCLYAATECKYYDWMGNHHEYRFANSQVGRAPDSDDESGGENEDEDYIDRGEGGWPESVWHVENHFDYMFDAGGHRVYRYAFKEDPNLSVLPEYGDGRPGSRSGRENECVIG